MLSNPLLLGGGADYQIQRSLRLRASATAYLSRTPASAGNRTTWTWSGWVKRGALGTARWLFGANEAGNQGYCAITFNASDQIYLLAGTTIPSNPHLATSSAVFRDPGAWYHVVTALDTTQATGSLRWRVWVNGVEQVMNMTATFPQNSTAGTVNSTQRHTVGGDTFSGIYTDGYVADSYFIDGQALTPSSFGQTDPVTGVWTAKKYTGTYGTNGFYLPFTDTTSTTTLCYDASGNANHWTPNNISLTAGATYDSMTDVPLAYGTTDRGNFCTLSPLSAGGGTLSYANLRVSGAAGTINGYREATLAVSGLIYYECTVVTAGNAGGFGVKSTTVGAEAPYTITMGATYLKSGNKRLNGVETAYGATFTSGDTIGVAVNTSAETIEFFKNNVSQGVVSLAGYFVNPHVPVVGFDDVSSPVTDANFGQRPFAYTPPAGFKALHTGNLSAPTITKPNKHFDVVLNTPAGAGSVSGLSLQPDLVWLKRRNLAENHNLYDSNRGATKVLVSNDTGAELTVATGVTAFNSDGFTFGTGAYASGQTYVNWLWKAGGAPVTNNAGSISAQVSANAAAGFSIVTYTGTGANATVGHGLGIAPKLVIVKDRSAVSNWVVQHGSLGWTQGFLGISTVAATTSANFSNNTAPTSAVFSISNYSFGTDNYVAYCFAEIAGYSKIGSYTGNGSTDGPFVYCGFRPRYLLVKQSSAAGEGWAVFDTARDTYNVVAGVFSANTSGAEGIGAYLDITSNGFKLRTTSASVNGSGSTYIYYAIAETPFQFALAR